VTNGLAGVLAKYSLGFCPEVEVLHDLPQGVFRELPHLKEVGLAKIAKLAGKLWIHFDAQSCCCHGVASVSVFIRPSILFVTEGYKNVSGERDGKFITYRSAAGSNFPA
jgi:hypothetical protein